MRKHAGLGISVFFTSCKLQWIVTVTMCAIYTGSTSLLVRSFCMHILTASWDLHTDIADITVRLGATECQDVYHNYHDK